AHFNHDLRGEESETDEKFVKNLTVNFDFEFALGKEKISSEGNLEQNARDERYKFLFETAESLHAHAILTAHTLNDQAETFLHNLMRGSGLQGLGGMKPVTTLDSRILLVRPLLKWATRGDTENFCRLNKVEFRYDSMNEDLKFNRVRIRKILIPMLEDFNPKIIETLANTASLMREENEFLDAAARKCFDEKKQIIENKETNDEGQTTKDETNNESLSLKDLKDLFPSMRKRILRDWLKTRRGDLRNLDAKHFQAIENLIFSRKSGKTIELPKGEILVKNSGNLTFMKNKG
ncbi:MAG: tRNA lysidine(34) synthetase TilS, partial [Acidobacteriota bacterium]